MITWDITADFRRAGLPQLLRTAVATIGSATLPFFVVMPIKFDV